MKKLQVILYLFLSCVILILFLEIALRLSGKLRTYSEKNFNVYQSPYEKNTKSHFLIGTANDTIYAVQEEFTYTYYLNEWGLNDLNNLESADKKSTYIYLGDSFTYGVGTPQDSTLPALLSLQNNCTFINAGFSGSDPFFENKLIDSLFAPLGFNNYVMMLNVSDLYDYIFRGGNERFLQNGTVRYNQAPWLEKIHEQSYFVRAIVHGIFRMDFTLLMPTEVKNRKSEAVTVYTSLLNEINESHHLIVVLQPYARQYGQGSQILNEVMHFSYLEELEERLEEIGVTTINLDKKLQKQINENNYLDYSWKIDGHYNSKGYNLLATILAEELAEKEICEVLITKGF